MTLNKPKVAGHLPEVWAFGLRVPIKFSLMTTLMVNKKSIELEQGTKGLVRVEQLNDCSTQRTLN